MQNTVRRRISLNRNYVNYPCASGHHVIHRCASNTILADSKLDGSRQLEPTLSDFMGSKQRSAAGSEYPTVGLFLKSNISLKFHVETYGCQMNLSDTEIVRSILLAAGHKETSAVEDAELIFQNTCAIRENAESKIWSRLKFFRSMRKSSSRKGYPKIGVLGCMAERLKEKLLEEEAVDLVCGPDAYRDLPRLLESVLSSDQKEANTQLSFEETYADISPVRKAGSESAFGETGSGLSFCALFFCLNLSDLIC